LFFLLFLVLPSEQGIRSLLAHPGGTIILPTGRIEIHSEIRLPDGTHDLTIQGNQTTLRAAADFTGRALFTCRACRNITIQNLAIDGNRSALEKPVPLAPTDVPFSHFYRNNGILIEDATGFRLERVDFANIANFALIVSHSNGVDILHMSVSNSGSRNARGRNNTSGGVLLEQGTDHFTIAYSVFHDIRGNGVWTHSCYQSPRNLHGKIEKNDFTNIGRDAIQVGHASDVLVLGNTGRRIGFMLDEVDLENLGTPVGIDTAGKVDHSTYQDNRFEEVDGKCIDLDGFFDGAIRGNTCINRGHPEDYPYGNFGIALNNSSIEMESKNILIEGNTLDGMKFGAIFVVGSGHRILHNTMIHLNEAHCNETHAKFGCIAIVNEPGFLESGIYLAARANRPGPSENITIEDNVISGWKMAKYCVRAAPGILLSDDYIKGNRCSE